MVTREESVNVEFRRIDYDIEKVARAVKNSLLPDKYAESLRVAR
jgi:hypothetical protein